MNGMNLLNEVLIILGVILLSIHLGWLTASGIGLIALAIVPYHK